tara:strand:+ start:1209 stop:1430 length:222 start_codon:yes stop_codon:yes gene_type:complete
MSKISMQLLQTDYSSYLKLKMSISKVKSGKIQSFGKEMNQKYSFNNNKLEKEKDDNIALLMIMKDHVEHKKAI